MRKNIEVKCPGCKKKFSYYESEFRPFCGEKCKLLDLGQWFDESYSIKGKNNTVYIEDPDSLENMISEDMIKDEY